MKKKNFLFLGTAALLLALLFAGCPQEADNGKSSASLISAISIAGVRVTLPAPAVSIAGAAARTVVVDTERPPLPSEDPTRVYYRQVQPVAVTLTNVNGTVLFMISAPGEDPDPLEIVLPHTEKTGSTVTRNMGITLPNANNFPEGQDVWLKVISANESKTEYYKISVINKTHDTAISSITVGGYDVLNPDQSVHIGPWLSGPSWAEAAAGQVNIKYSEAAVVVTSATPRNDQFASAKPRFGYAKILAANAAGPAEPTWNAAAPTAFADGDILAVRVTASNGHTMGYLKIKVSVGGSPFLASLTVDGKAIVLGSPSSDMANIPAPAYRVDDGLTLTASPVTWTVSPVAADPEATVNWAIVAKGAVPQASDFTGPTSFDTTHNYLYIRVVSANEEFTMYYLVIYDERSKDTEHIKTAAKGVPVYRFTIPTGKTWGDMGNMPKVRIKLLQEEAEYNQAGGYQRNFVFGELSKLPLTGSNALSTANLSINVGASTWNPYQPFRQDRAAKDFAIDTPAPGMWYTVEWPLNNDPPTWRPPWDPNTTSPPETTVSWNNTYWPAANVTGDVYFGIGITHDAVREYWIKELSLVSEDGELQIFCNLLGNGRIDATDNTRGFVRVDSAGSLTFLREMVADPTLK